MTSMSSGFLTQRRTFPPYFSRRDLMVVHGAEGVILYAMPLTRYDGLIVDGRLRGDYTPG